MATRFWLWVLLAFSLLLSFVFGLIPQGARAQDSGRGQGQGPTKGIQWTLPGGGEDASFYPCDAGILHLPLAPGRQCRFLGTDTSCAPHQAGLTFTAAGVSTAGVNSFAGIPVSAENESAHTCACASAQSHRGEFIRYVAGIPLEDNGETGPGSLEVRGGVVAGTDKGGVISVERLREFPNQNGRIAASFAEPLSEISFNLGSEAFGAQYFIDLCYLGTPPQKTAASNPRGGGARQDLPNFTANAFLTLTNPGSVASSSPPGSVGLLYQSFAGIKGNWDLACSTFDTTNPQADLSTDFRKIGISDSGKRPFPASLGASSTFYDAPPSAEEGWVGQLTAEFAKSGDFSTLSTQVSTLFGTATQPLVVTKGNEGKVPRACRLRLYFWEAASGRLRSWQQGGARFTVKWNVQGVVE
ncbi:MAG: hypothetical protein IOD12_07175 [Silvanigrellales bacterium]|nr:hypothetical protein [Silvanigrellales bacterium]